MTTVTDSQVEAALAAWHGWSVEEERLIMSPIEAKMMRAALEAAEAVREDRWRPIDEAPKDETFVLLCDARFKDAYLIAMWHLDLQCWTGRPRRDGRFTIWESATHFRPLPPPPEGDGK